MAASEDTTISIINIINDTVSDASYEAKQEPEILQLCKEFEESRSQLTRYTQKLPEVGDKVVLTTKNMMGKHLEGVVKYAGEVTAKKGIQFGVELSRGRGTTDGSVKGETYFTTSKGARNGVFAASNEILKVNDVQFVKLMGEVLPGDLKPEKIHGRVITDRNIEDWVDPFCVVECATIGRKKYTDIPSHEYEDRPETLLAKVKVLADLIKKSQKCCVYSGAGLSTSSGIADYASKFSGELSKKNVGGKKAKSNKLALPNIGHRTFAALAKEGFVESWIQQNHDGLPQKAGFPQHRINEIHGAWFDPSNPVVPMSGSLRDDLYDWFVEIKNTADLVIAVGTSLSGMHADDVFKSACKAQAGRVSDHKGTSLGGVIIGLQQTQLDDRSYLRIYSRVDTVVSLLARELKVVVPELVIPIQYEPAPGSQLAENVFKVPYDSEGNLTEDEDEMVVWDLRKGAKVKVTDGPGESFEGTLEGIKEKLFYRIRLPNQRQGKDLGKGEKLYSLGLWWIETATKGLCPKLPVVNIKESLKTQSAWEE